jgi:cytochrome c oxidase subunit 2
MKTLLKLIAAAAAFGMAPAALHAQAAPAAAPAAQAPAPAAAPAAGAPRDAISANSQAAPAQPEEFNADPDNRGEGPSNASVLSSSLARTAPEATVGQPVADEWGFQPQVTPIGEKGLWFHNAILMPIITIISLFVLALLIWVMIRYRRGRNPVPSRTTHNTMLEVVWTLVPVVILVGIALPSVSHLRAQYSPPKADLTIKAIGNQWRWDYEYPDHGVSLVSNMLKDEDAKARGEPRLLAVDERVVVPVGATVKVIVTSNDVIHSWGIPAFWAKIDAVPGRLNETWFKTDRPGVYYGQCFELCGARHAYMPIAVEVVAPAQFAAWVASKGGKMPDAANPPTGPDTTAGSPITNPQPKAGQATGGASGATETTPAPTGVNPGTATPPVSSQGATNSKRGS